MGFTLLAIALLAVSFLANFSKAKLINKCDVSNGKWVFDNSYPLYDSLKCPPMVATFNCLKNGRQDREFLKYRWQPQNCNLTRWNGEDMLMKIRGKRVMFVGDSLSMNQWQSLICMLHAASPTSKYTLSRNGLLSTFSIPELKITVMYMRNALLVDVVIEGGLRVLKLDSVVGSAKSWTGNDILIFDTWHWWLHSGRKQIWDEIHYGNLKRKDMDRLFAYELGLRTWARWVDRNIDTRRVKIFFQGVSPDHWDGAEWGKPHEEHCGVQRTPLDLQAYLGGPQDADVVLTKVLSQMIKPVHLLSLSKLSQLRLDGHPALHWSDRKRGLDCTHWCLPGVPDTWNELLYAALDGRI